MARHRIGNDITIVWTVNDGNGNPLPLSDKDVRLYYSCESGRYKAEITIQDTNKVVWDFYGGLQKTLGAYSLTLEILQSEGKRSIKKDVCGAFVLVGKDCEADAKETTVNGELAVYQEMITTNLDIARISPVIPVIMEDENGVGYWHVDGVNTGKPARGEKGDVVDASYMVFDVDENMDLNLTFLSTNDQLELDFEIDDNGYLTVDK